MKHIYILLVVALGWQATQAQGKRTPAKQQHLHLAALAKGYGDSVVIRWAPTDPQAWLAGSKAGYHITRIDLSQPGHPVKSDLSPTGIFPTPKDQLLKGLDTTNEQTKYVAVAEKMLYGGDYSVSKTAARSFTGQLKNEHSALSLKYMLAMMSADYYAPAATALGLRWVDRQVQQGGKYVYIITCPAADKTYVVDSTEIFALNVKAKTEPLPKGLEATPGDRKVALQWNRRQTGNFSGYLIERSEDGGQHYRSLTKGPYNSTYIPPSGDKKRDSLISKQNPLLIDHQVYTDSLPENYKTYYYRLRGINGFGELSPYTSAISVSGSDLTPPSAPVIDSVRNTAGRNVRLWWKQTRRDGDLAGYYVDRGTSAKGPFKLITAKMLDKNATGFTDTGAMPHQPNFYVVVAVDTSKNSAVSLPGLAYLTDTIPPAIPTGVAGTIDSSGIVHLHWTANREADLKGYQVYTSYNPTNRFSQVTTSILSDTTFTDSVATKSLDRRVYYKIVALDQNFNHSGLSSVATLRKLIIIPPSAPVAGKVSSGHSGISIEWIQSRSEGAMDYEVYRKEAGHDWQPLTRMKQDWTVATLRLTDSSIRSNTDYYYAAETIDSTGVRSARSYVVHANDHEVAGLQGVKGFRAFYDGKGQVVQLNWELPGGAAASGGAGENGSAAGSSYFFIVYRSVNGGPLNLWHSFDQGTNSCQDNTVQQATYHYAIKILSRNPDSESALSQLILVDVPGNSINHSSR